MSTPLQDAIQQLAKSLTDAAHAEDWPTLERLNAEVDKLLRKLRPVPEQARPALAELRQAHSDARYQAEAAAAELAGRIESLQQNREGLRAYEQSGGLE